MNRPRGVGGNTGLAHPLSHLVLFGHWRKDRQKGSCTIMQVKYDVFLSYRSSEIDIRDDLRAKLETMGLRVWVDHNRIREGEAPKKDGIQVGDDWLTTIIAAIQTTPIFIGLFSPEAVKSTIVNLEMSLAYHLYKHQTDGSRLHIPIFMDNVQIPQIYTDRLLGGFQGFEARNASERPQTWQKVKDFITAQRPDLAYRGLLQLITPAGWTALREGRQSLSVENHRLNHEFRDDLMKMHRDLEARRLVTNGSTYDLWRLTADGANFLLEIYRAAHPENP